MKKYLLADFDGDGDLDIICGEFVDGLTWFENKGDGREDLLVSDEDGTVCLLRNTGKVRKGMPVFEDSVQWIGTRITFPIFSPVQKTVIST